ncbi:MAG: hypothetical protein ACO3YQ_03675 [Flavobacteriales bacterium]
MMLKFKKMLCASPGHAHLTCAVCALSVSSVLGQTTAESIAPRIVLPEEVAVWDAAVRAHPVPAEGYRIQLYLGELQAARQLRADLRKSAVLSVYVMDLTPNYRVCIGDFRDRWSAEFERRSWLAAYPAATVIRSPIAPPPLPKIEGEPQ